MEFLKTGAQHDSKSQDFHYPAERGRETERKGGRERQKESECVREREREEIKGGG